MNVCTFVISVIGSCCSVGRLAAGTLTVGAGALTAGRVTVGAGATALMKGTFGLLVAFVLGLGGL